MKDEHILDSASLVLMSVKACVVIKDFLGYHMDASMLIRAESDRALDRVLECSHIQCPI